MIITSPWLCGLTNVLIILYVVLLVFSTSFISLHNLHVISLMCISFTGVFLCTGVSWDDQNGGYSTRGLFKLCEESSIVCTCTDEKKINFEGFT